MPRSPRVVLAAYPHHVVHRGHNRRVIFETPGDFASYLDSLDELRALYCVKVRAYCLMPNHAHLLLEPESSDGLGRLMKRLAGRHTARLNRRESRTGALWEGRFYSSLVARDTYFQECCRYIELNPVRASLVENPVSYPWSSCRYRTGVELARWLEFDPWFLAMGRTASERWDVYSDFLRQGVPEDRGKLIREAVYRGQLTGGPEFAKEVECATGRRVVRRGPGRPKGK